MTQDAASTPHLACLDRFRGIAILGVFCAHVVGGAYGARGLPWKDGHRDFTQPLGDWSYLLFAPLTYGSFGVPLFFIISGFCIHLSHDPVRDTWAFFYNRRFWRIYPPYLLVLLVMASGNLFFADPLHNIWASGPENGFFHVGMHAALVHNFLPSTLYSICPAYWSIAIEVQLYLIYFLLFYLMRLTSWRTALIVVGIIEWGIRSLPALLPSAVDSRWLYEVEKTPMAFWFSWALGAFLADRYRAMDIQVAPRWVPWFLVLLIGLSAIFAKTDTFFFSLAALASFFVVSRTIVDEGAGLISTGFISRHLASVGQCSYSFYLIHQPIVQLYCLTFSKVCHLRWLVVLGGVVLWRAIFVLSQWVYRHVEKPSIRFGYRFWSACTRSTA